LPIEKASEMGFCTGVRRAIAMIEKASRELGPLETLGPVVHNQQVINKLALEGIQVAENLDQVQGKVVAISSHGVAPQVVAEVEKRGLKLIDTTCPFVRRAQVAAQSLADDGFFVIVFGEESHPEVQGVLGWTKGKGIATLEVPLLEKMPPRIGILSQTTQNLANFASFVAEFVQSDLASISELRVVNTVCDATRKRQEAALELAKRVDLMVVVGSRSSANTQRLAEICAATGVATYRIETAVEVDPSWIGDRRRVGITAGASTPDFSIDEVVAKLERLGQQGGNCGAV